MQKDIKKMLEDYKETNVELSGNHAKKFEALLQQEIHQQKPQKQYFKWLSIAASIILLVSLGIQFYPTKDVVENLNNKDVEINSSQKQITLGNISPEFNTIEKYYTNSIKLAISQLEINDSNKEVLDGYLIKIAELTKEYQLLTQELNTKGVNDATINALISNLQLRLQLLQRLKKQLKQLKNLKSKQNETQII